MRTFLTAGLLLAACAGFSGCGGGSSAATNPTDLPPLTAEESQQFEQEQTQIRQEEESGILKPAKPTRTRPKPANPLERF